MAWRIYARAESTAMYICKEMPMQDLPQ